MYIIYFNLFGKGYLGVKKKIFAQIRVFENFFGNVYYTVYSGQMMYLMSGDTVLEKDLALTKRECNNLVVSWIEKYSIFKTYIRYEYSDMWFISYLKWQKENKIKSILEFPTIPYSGELSNRRIMLEDEYYREQLHYYIEQATTYSNDSYVFGIPAIKLQNGVEIPDYQKFNMKEDYNSIVLITVSLLAKWQGYERIINGLADYYRNGGNKKIYFKIIGSGNQLDYYKNISKKNHIEDYVKFYGELEGNELDKQYYSSDIGVGCLGMYKKGGEYATSIKLREYCAYGIPFIYGYTDAGFTGDEEYVLKVDNCSSPVDMNKVITFYERLNKMQDYIKIMKHKAETEFSWEVILKNVISYFD